MGPSAYGVDGPVPGVDSAIDAQPSCASLVKVSIVKSGPRSSVSICMRNSRNMVPGPTTGAARTSALVHKSHENDKRQDIIDHCLKMNANGLNQGTSGNVSVRHEDGLLISPSGIPYDDLTTADIVYVDHEGTAHSELNPSSEWRFHLAIMGQREDVHAVVHCHPTYSTALAMCHLEIPASHYMIAAAGGDSIPCATYATFGTAELSKSVIKALKDRSACLMANHGIISCGSSLAKAMWLGVEVETLAHQYVIARSIGTPQLS